MYKDLTRKTNFFEELSWFKFNNLELAQGMTLKFFTSLAKEKVKKSEILDAKSYVCRSYIGKTSSRRLFAPHPKKD